MPQIFSLPMLRWLGGLLAVFGLAFVGYRFELHAREISWTGLPAGAIAAGLIAVAGHVVAGTVLAFAWRQLLAHLGTEVDRSWALGVFGLSQIARYIPGNVFQYLGRQALGASARIEAGALVRSTLWELGSVIAAGGFLAGLTLLDFWIGSPAWMSVSCAVAGIALARLLLPPHLSSAVLLHAGYHAIVGLLFSLIILSFSPAAAVLEWHSVLALTGAYIAACLAGLLVPGAPAGLGMREAVLYGLLHWWTNQTDLLVALVLARLANIVGDVFFFLCALLLRTRLELHRRISTEGTNES